MTISRTTILVSLKVLTGTRRGALVPISRFPFLIGKDTDCQLRPMSPEVESRHCVIEWSVSGPLVSDCGTVAGTWINETRIEQPFAVGDGDELRVGPIAFKILIEVGRSLRFLLPRPVHFCRIIPFAAPNEAFPTRWNSVS